MHLDPHLPGNKDFFSDDEDKKGDAENIDDNSDNDDEDEYLKTSMKRSIL